LTFEDIDPTEDSGMGHGTAEAEVGVTGKASDCRTHLELGRGLDVDVKFDVVEGRTGGRDRGELAAAFQISAEVEAGSHGNFVDADFAGHGGSGAGPEPMQFGVGSRAHAGWITQANALAGGREIEVELLVEVSGIAFEVEGASAGAGGERLDMKAITGE
jgi:hypothetical protein